MHVFIPNNIVSIVLPELVHYESSVYKQNIKKMDCIVSMQNEKKSIFFFKKDTIYEVIWADIIDKRQTFEELRSWYLEIEKETLKAQLYDALDIEYWFGLNRF